MIRNDVARDPLLSYRASGILADILSRPDNWTATAANMAKARPSGEGVRAILSALRELEQAGYLRRERVRGDGGRFRWVQTIYDVPAPGRQEESIDVSAGRSTSRKPQDGNHPMETAVPKKTGEEDQQEDVNDPTSPGAGRFAPDAGRAQQHEPSSEPDDTEEPATAAALNNWRSKDREAFRYFVGNEITSSGERWREGRFTADAFYTAFRKQQQKIRWPGRFLDALYASGAEQAIDDWLLDQGLERTG